MDLIGLKELEKISQEVGKCPDLVQGGGGNTSAKLDDRYMAVKASGYRLDQVTEDDGYVIVDYQKIREYFRTVDIDRDVNFEKESAGFMKECVLADKNPKSLRPSIETGFHSFMGKYVIHTHSVYANILCCSKEGKDIAHKIFDDGFAMLWVPYINPGFDLTIELNKAIKGYRDEKGYSPDIVFMENHGVIVSGDTSEGCLNLHERVNRAIIEHFNLDTPYPEIRIDRIEKDRYKSLTSYLRETLVKKSIGPELFKEIILYPDQLVYLGDNISFKGDGKINIDSNTGEVVYATNETEAITIDETLTAYIYVVDKVEELGLTIQTMSEDAILFIRNMEGEKYRKSLLKDAVAMKGFHHLAIRVTDFDASVKFYTEGLGFLPKLSWGEGDSRAILMDTGDGNYLEIFAGGPQEEKPEGHWIHVAFRTDDCKAALDRAKAAGAKVTMEVKDVTLGEDTSIDARIAFFKGPDGELIELFQEKV